MEGRAHLRPYKLTLDAFTENVWRSAHPDRPDSSFQVGTLFLPLPVQLCGAAPGSLTRIRAQTPADATSGERRRDR